MVALAYTSKAMNRIFGPEQFLAFYLTSGVVASLTSCYGRVLTGRVGLSLGAVRFKFELFFKKFTSLIKTLF